MNYLSDLWNDTGIFWHKHLFIRSRPTDTKNGSKWQMLRRYDIHLDKYQVDTPFLGILKNNQMLQNYSNQHK